jgi:hypothetical protein
MTSSRNPPSAAFWATVLVVGLFFAAILYVVSGVVVVELGRRGVLKDRSLENSAFYAPLGCLASHFSD